MTFEDINSLANFSNLGNMIAPRQFKINKYTQIFSEISYSCHLATYRNSKILVLKNKKLNLTGLNTLQNNPLYSFATHCHYQQNYNIVSSA